MRRLSLVVTIAALVVLGGSRPSAAAMPSLVSYRVSQHPGYDRLVFAFSGGFPSWKARYVRSVTMDASGAPVRLEGRAFLLVTLMGLDWTNHVPPEPVMTPRLAVLRQLKPAGVFEGYFSFGLGLAYRTSYEFTVLRRPDRLTLDLARRRASTSTMRRSR